MNKFFRKKAGLYDFINSAAVKHPYLTNTIGGALVGGGTYGVARALGVGRLASLLTGMATGVAGYFGTDKLRDYAWHRWGSGEQADQLHKGILAIIEAGRNNIKHSRGILNKQKDDLKGQRLISTQHLDAVLSSLDTAEKRLDGIESTSREAANRMSIYLPKDRRFRSDQDVAKFVEKLRGDSRLMELDAESSVTTK